MNKKFKYANNIKILNYYQLNKFNYKLLNEIPFIKKIVIAFDLKSTDFKKIISAHLALKILFYKKSTFTKVIIPNAQHKTRVGQPVGCKITENSKIKNLDLASFVFITTPTYKKKNSFKLNNLTYSVSEIYNHEKLESHYLWFNRLNKLNISFLIKSNNKKYCKSFFSHIF